MFSQFRHCYPQGSLISELVQIDHGKYIVRALVQVEGITLATGLAAADTIEKAEDSARERALALIDLSEVAVTTSPSPAIATKEVVKESLTKEELTSSQPLPSVAVKPEDNGSNGQENLVPDAKNTETKRKKKTIPQVLDSDKINSVEIALEDKETTEPEPLIVETPAPPLTANHEVDIAEVETSPLESSLEPEPDSSHHEVELPLKTDSSEVKIPPVPSTQDKNGNDHVGSPPKKPTPINEPLDFSDIIAKSNVELKRLGWTNEQGKDYLLQTYGKRSRQLLSDEELLEFLHYLESLPN